jgi:hypothetical protein
VSLSATHSFEQFDANGRLYYSRPARGIRNADLGPAGSDKEVLVGMRRQANQAHERMATKALTMEQQAAAHNQAVIAMNDRIHPVLAATTGENFGGNVRRWWDWWQDYTEYDDTGVTPVYEQLYTEFTNYVHRPDRHYVQPSCFVKGTLVWTKTGLQRIENVQRGDLVLSKNVDTGELAFKPVIGTTVRSPSQILSLAMGDERIGATLGHPFWVSGLGWRMAKQLSDGAIIHGVNEPLRVDDVERLEKAEAHNLVVADFNTYFVGEAGILVHDNTPVRPTAAVVPGVAKELMP